jgi:hypothetical protein
VPDGDEQLAGDGHNGLVVTQARFRGGPVLAASGDGCWPPSAPPRP